jgi:hypothetical protein
MLNSGLNKQNYDSVMPLLMNYTPSTKIEESDASRQLVYDYWKQIIPVEMRTVGTNSLKTSTTRKPSGSGYVTASDRKNAVDDSKSVK